MEKKGSLKLVFIVMLASLVIVWLWDKIPQIKDFAHKILDPSVGQLFDWNITYGMLIVVFLISIVMTIVQKYTTNQEEIKRIKAEQKKINEDMKKFKDDPKKLTEVQKNLLPLTFELMQHSMRPIVYTGIPLILFFRWFHDYFSAIPEFKFFGFLGWIWFYLIFTILFSSILRKIFNVH